LLYQANATALRDDVCDRLCRSIEMRPVEAADAKGVSRHHAEVRVELR